MAFGPGARIGIYEITAPIGEGGMGAVYRARDTQLDRDVALKVLPDSFSNDPDRVARFTRAATSCCSICRTPMPLMIDVHVAEPDTWPVTGLYVQLRPPLPMP